MDVYVCCDCLYCEIVGVVCFKDFFVGGYDFFDGCVFWCWYVDFFLMVIDNSYDSYVM